MHHMVRVAANRRPGSGAGCGAPRSTLRAPVLCGAVPEASLPGTPFAAPPGKDFPAQRQVPARLAPGDEHADDTDDDHEELERHGPAEGIEVVQLGARPGGLLLEVHQPANDVNGYQGGQESADVDDAGGCANDMLRIEGAGKVEPDHGGRAADGDEDDQDNKHPQGRPAWPKDDRQPAQRDAQDDAEGDVGPAGSDTGPPPHPGPGRRPSQRPRRWTEAPRQAPGTIPAPRPGTGSPTSAGRRWRRTAW